MFLLKVDTADGSQLEIDPEKGRCCLSFQVEEHQLRHNIDPSDGYFYDFLLCIIFMFV